MSGSQDKFLMRHLKNGKVKELGSHPSLDGAKTFGKNRGTIEEVVLEEKKKEGLLRKCLDVNQCNKVAILSGAKDPVE